MAPTRSQIYAIAAALVLLAACASPIAAQAPTPRPSPSRPATTFNARINGNAAGIGNNTRAYGVAQIKILGNNRATLSFEVDRITSLTVAHIHVAAPGQNGPPVVTVYQPSLTGLSQPISGNFKTSKNAPIPFDPSANGLYNQLLSGNAYINFHTTAFPNGEIRGNFVAA